MQSVAVAFLLSGTNTNQKDIKNYLFFNISFYVCCKSCGKKEKKWKVVAARKVI